MNDQTTQTPVDPLTIGDPLDGRLRTAAIIAMDHFQHHPDIITYKHGEVLSHFAMQSYKEVERLLTKCDQLQTEIEQKVGSLVIGGPANGKRIHTDMSRVDVPVFSLTGTSMFRYERYQMSPEKSVLLPEGVKDKAGYVIEAMAEALKGERR